MNRVKNTNADRILRSPVPQNMCWQDCRCKTGQDAVLVMPRGIMGTFTIAFSLLIIIGPNAIC